MEGGRTFSEERLEQLRVSSTFQKECASFPVVLDLSSSVPCCGDRQAAPWPRETTNPAAAASALESVLL